MSPSVPIVICVKTFRSNALLLVSMNDNGELESVPLTYIKTGPHGDRAVLFRRAGRLYVLCVAPTADVCCIYEIMPDTSLVRLCRYSAGVLDCSREVTAEICVYIHRNEQVIAVTSTDNIVYVGVGNEIVCIDIALMLLLRVVNVQSRVIDICVYGGIVYFIREYSGDAQLPAGYVEIVRPLLNVKTKIPLFIYGVDGISVLLHAMYIEEMYEVPIHMTGNTVYVDDLVPTPIDVTWTETNDGILRRIRGDSIETLIDGASYFHNLPSTGNFYVWFVLNADKAICGKRYG